MLYMIPHSSSRFRPIPATREVDPVHEALFFKILEQVCNEVSNKEKHDDGPENDVRLGAHVRRCSKGLQQQAMCSIRQDPTAVPITVEGNEPPSVNASFSGIAGTCRGGTLNCTQRLNFARPMVQLWTNQCRSSKKI